MPIVPRASVAESPESPVSPIPLKAVPNLAACAAIRMSHASAKPSPAPTHVPLMAAMTGLGIVAREVTIGL